MLGKAETCGVEWGPSHLRAGLCRQWLPVPWGSFMALGGEHKSGWKLELGLGPGSATSCPSALVSQLLIASHDLPSSSVRVQTR